MYVIYEITRSESELGAASCSAMLLNLSARAFESTLRKTTFSRSAFLLSLTEQARHLSVPDASPKTP